MNNIQRKVFRVLDASDHSNPLSQAFNFFLIVLIVLNTLAVTLETVDSINERYNTLFNNFETFSVVIFTVEFILRLWSITTSPRFANPVTGRVKFLFTGSAIIDLLAIVPFYLPMIIGFDLRFI